MNNLMKKNIKICGPIATGIVICSILFYSYIPQNGALAFILGLLAGISFVAMIVYFGYLIKTSKKRK